MQLHPGVAVHERKKTHATKKTKNRVRLLLAIPQCRLAFTRKKSGMFWQRRLLPSVWGLRITSS